jgi:lipoprotein-anchoring transpeptidase ErfK/SrfK
MTSLLRQRPRRPCFPRVNITLCIPAVAALGAQSAAAQNCFLFFCRVQPDWQAPSGWQGTPVPEPDRPGEPSQPYLSGPDTYSTIYYPTADPPGTVVIDPQRHFLYLVEGGGRAIRYGVGVGRTGFEWSGVATVHDKQEWPDWYPPKEMIERQPEIRRMMSELQSGVGMHGGPRNPLGARALYLWKGNKDTLYRIHGTVEPWTIGKNVSSGCIRMINQDVIDLYQRTPIGARVQVLPSRASAVRP